MDRRLIPTLLGAIIIALGFVVLFGWHAQVDFLLRLNPSWSAMQYNTALLFALCGMGLIASTRGLRWAGGVLGAIVALFAAVTLAQYVLGFDAGLDQLFFKTHSIAGTSFPGRMALSTSLAFVLSGSTLLLLAMDGRRRGGLLRRVASLLAVCDAAMGAMALLGYFTDLRTLFTWGPFIPMAAHTACGHLMLGVGLACWAYPGKSVRAADRLYWIGAAVTSGLLILTLLLWDGVRRLESQLLSQNLETEAIWASQHFEDALLERIHAFDRMAERWEAAGGTPQNLWRADAAAYIRDLPGFDAIIWADAGGQVRWIVPESDREALKGVDLTEVPAYAPVLKAARQTQTTILKGQIRTTQNEGSIPAVRGLFSAQRFDGYFIGVNRTQTLCLSLSREITERGYELEVLFEGDRIFQSRETQPDDAAYARARSSTLDQAAGAWQIKIWPTLATIAKYNTILPILLLVSGMALALLSAFATRLWALSLVRSSEIKEAQALAQRVQKQFEDLFEFAPDSIVMMSAEGKIALVNKQAELLFGYTRAELVGEPIEMLLPASSRHKHVPLRRDYLNNPRPRMMGNRQSELFGIKKDGTLFPVEISLSPLETESGPVVAAAVRDVTDRHRTQLELQITRERMELAIQAAGVGIWDWNLSDGEIVWNDQMCALYGMEPGASAPTYESWQRVVHSDDLAQVEASIRAALDGTAEYDSEFRIQLPDGTKRVIHALGVVRRNEQGAPLRMLGTNIDVTLLRQADDALRESEQRFRGAFERSAIGMALIGLKGEWLEVNQAICKIVGYSEHELAGLTFQDITHPDDVTADIQQAADLLQGRISFYEMEKRYIPKNGEPVWARLSVSMVRRSDATPLYYVSLVEDITARKTAELALRNANLMQDAILNGVNVSIISTDPEGVIRTVNRAAERMLGYSREELVGSTPAMLHDESEICHRAAELSQELQIAIEPGFDVFVAAARRGGADEREWTYIRKDGSRFPVLLSVTAMWDESEHLWGFIGIAADISDRKRDERNFRAMEERWQFALEGSDAGAWDCDLQTGELSLSERWRSMLGREASTFGQTLEEKNSLIHPDDRAAATALFESHLRGESAVYLSEHRMRCWDGRYCWILDRGKVVARDGQGKPLRIVGTQTDVTERHEYIERLGETQARLEAFIEHAPAAVAMFDTELRYIAATQRWYSAYGIEGRQIIGHSHYEIFPEIPEHWKAVHQRNLAGIVEKCDEDPFVRSDGSTQWVRWENRPWYRADGSVGGIMMLTQDVTQRMELENSIKESLAEKEILLKEIHHRVKNNLQVVSSLLNLQAGKVSDPEQRQVFAESRLRIQSMAMVHEQLYRTGNLASIDFTNHLRQLGALQLRANVKDNQKIRIHYDLETVETEVDVAIPLGLIANELISNALKHAFEDRPLGTITIVLRCLDDQIRLGVSDDGIGLPSAIDIEKTTSVGLRLVRSLVRQLQGKLEVGHGSGGNFEVLTNVQSRG